MADDKDLFEDDEEIKNLRRDAAIAKALSERAEDEKKIAEFNLAKFKTGLSVFEASSKTPASSGDVTFDEKASFPEAQILAQDTARKAAQKLALELKKSKPEKLIIYSEVDLNALSAYEAFWQQFGQLTTEHQNRRKEFEKAVSDAKKVLNNPSFNDAEAEILPTAIPSALVAAPLIAGAVAKSFTEIIGLLRPEIKVSSKETVISDDFVISCLVKALPDVRFFHPKVYLPPIFELDQTDEFLTVRNAVHEENARTKTKLEELNQTTDELAQSVAERKTKVSENKASINDKLAELKKLPENDEKRPPIEAEITKLKSENIKLLQQISRLDIAATALKRQKTPADYLISITDQLNGSLNTPNATTNTSPLVQMLRISHLRNLLQQDNSFILRLSATAFGSTEINKPPLWFTSRIYSAGASITYQLFTTDGQIRQADSINLYQKAESQDVIQNLFGREADAARKNSGGAE